MCCFISSQCKEFFGLSPLTGLRIMMNQIVLLSAVANCTLQIMQTFTNKYIHNTFTEGESVKKFKINLIF